MGSGSSDSRGSTLAAGNTAATNTYNQTFQNYQPSALEKRTSDDAMNWMDFTEGKNGPVDYTKAPGLVHLGMYDEAAANRFAERSATGGLEMGKDGGNATALGMRKQQLADQMGERRGQDLVNAVRAKDATVRGEIAPFLIGTENNRQQALLTSAGNQASGARNAYASYTPPTPFWQTAVTAGLGAAGQIFAGKG